MTGHYGDGAFVLVTALVVLTFCVIVLGVTVQELRCCLVALRADHQQEIGRLQARIKELEAGPAVDVFTAEHQIRGLYEAIEHYD